MEPGGKVVRIEPHLGDLEWAEGGFPAPHGVITVKHKRLLNGKIESHVQARFGVKIIKRCPDRVNYVVVLMHY